jgi:hypothetical protein
VVVTDKVERLREAGLITASGELPGEYRGVVESLTEDELDIIVSVKKRLDLADASSKASPPGDDVARRMPPFTSYMVF